MISKSRDKSQQPMHKVIIIEVQIRKDEGYNKQSANQLSKYLQLNLSR